MRIFDISNLDAPVQVAAVQTCRGSHTHTLLKSPNDADNLYVYVSGTGGVRSSTEMASCVNAGATNPNSSLYRIEVIKVPLAAPQNAAVVNESRLFTDPVTGAMNGLQNAPPTPQHPSGMNWGPTPITDACHDITTYPEIGLAAGACEGNGLLIDISDPANPKRIDAVADPNYAYWHGATFSNDGTKVVFTDEWGGGTAARCRATDQLSWGADAIFDIVRPDSSSSAATTRCPQRSRSRRTASPICRRSSRCLGRDIMVQAWYQGGASMVDFTDSAHPKEIGYYDRGPISATSLVLGGLWSSYYYNGAVYGSEIARGFDAWKLVPNAELSKDEITAASEVVLDRLTPQHQPRLVNPPSFAKVRSFRDQLVRRPNGIDKATLTRVDTLLGNAEKHRAAGNERAAETSLAALAFQLRGNPRYAAMRAAILELAAAE